MTVWYIIVIIVRNFILLFYCLYSGWFLKLPLSREIVQYAGYIG